MDPMPPAPPPEQPPPAESTSEPPPPSAPHSSEVPQPPLATQLQTHYREPPPPPSTTTTTTTNSALQPIPTTPSIPSLPSTPQPKTATTPTTPSAFTRQQSSTSSEFTVQRGGMSVGVSSPQPTLYVFNTPPFGLARKMLDTRPSSTNSLVRQPTQGMGITGSLGASSAMRPTGVLGNQLKPMPVRPPSGSNMQSVNNQPQNQPWLSSAAQAKPLLPPPSIRLQLNPQSLQQRAHIPQQKQQTAATTMQQQQTSSHVKQLSNPSQPLEQLLQQYPPPRAQLPVPHQQQIGKSQSLGTEKPSSLAVVQAGAIHSGPPIKETDTPPIKETKETCNRLLGKRTIQELVNQIDSSEMLEPGVEDILVDIAEDFVESIATFGCSLAKHRKSTVLEAKDIILHVERNWNMTLPGFGGDEIKLYKKPLTNDLHKERLAVIKKSIVESGSTNAKSSAGQVAGSNPKSHSAKGSANMLGSPNFEDS